MKLVALATEESGTLIGGVASHLNHHSAVDVGQASETDAARFQMNEYDVVGGEPSPSQQFDREEVGTCKDGHVGGDKIFHVVFLAPFGCRWDPVPVEDVSHRLVGNGVAEIGQGSGDAIVSPAGVLSGKRTMSNSSSGAMRGRPGPLRNLEPSFAGYEQNGARRDRVGFSDTGDLLKSSPPEPFADFSESRSLGIRKA